MMRPLMDPGIQQPAAPSGWGLVAAIVIAVGAIVGLTSVFLPWARITESTFEGGTVLGEVVPSLEELGFSEIPEPTGGDVPSAPGRRDTAGFLAGILFVAALGGAAFAASRSRGVGALLAMGSGALSLVLALTGLFRSHAIATAALRDDLHREVGGLFGPNPLLGGVLDRMVDEALGLFAFESSPAVGVYLSIVAALVVIVGGWLAIPPERAREGSGVEPAASGEPSTSGDDPPPETSAPL